jgi:hypothetical protein
LIAVVISIFWGDKYWLYKTFAVIFSDKVENRPLNSFLSILGKLKIFRVIGKVILRIKKLRRPPTTESLKAIPFVFPLSF